MGNTLVCKSVFGDCPDVLKLQFIGQDDMFTTFTTKWKVNLVPRLFTFAKIHFFVVGKGTDALFGKTF